jgi:hypothetical protein
MSIHHITVTLLATATPISSPTAGNPSIRAREVWFESETGNADVKIGGPTVSATDYGRTLQAGPANAFVCRQPSHSYNLADIWLLGTATQKVHIMYSQ